MKRKYNTPSRRRTPWDNKENLTELEVFIQSNYLDSFWHKHPKLKETNEAELLNSFVLNRCKYCYSKQIVKRGFTKNKIQRYLCKECSKTMTITTGTIFEDHKVSITEWIDFSLELFAYNSTNNISKANKNSYTTSKYWLHKIFTLLEDYTNEIVLTGNVQIDETYFPVMKQDKTTIDGKKLRGLSKDQFCIAVGYDGKYIYAKVEGMGKPSGKKTLAVFENHIQLNSTLIHDKEKSHRVLVEKLELDEKVYDSKEIIKLPDKENPLREINHICDLLKKFLKSHSGFNREDLPGYINLFCFIMNPPDNRLEKVEKLLNCAISSAKTLHFRDLYAKK